MHSGLQPQLKAIITLDGADGVLVRTRAPRNNFCSSKIVIVTSNALVSPKVEVTKSSDYFGLKSYFHILFFLTELVL